jgi:hypothetical protein
VVGAARPVELHPVHDLLGELGAGRDHDLAGAFERINQLSLPLVAGGVGGRRST